MIKIIPTSIVTYILAIILWVLMPAYFFAGDLPINIDAIGRQDWADTTLMLRFDIDLFSENARLVNLAIEEQLLLNRGETESSLFNYYQLNQSVDINYIIANAAYSFDLFPGPVSFGAMGHVEIGEEIPLWLMVAVLIVSGVVGIILAGFIGNRKGYKASVHNVNS